MNISSPTFEPLKQLPVAYTCSGQSLSPTLNWSVVPPQTKSLALVVDDPDAPQGVFTHWILYNIPPSMNGLPEGFGSDGKSAPQIQSGLNSAGKTGYFSPCPPVGETHNYYFRLYALDTDLHPSGQINRDQLYDSMQGHVLEATSLVAYFGRVQGK